MNAVRSDQLDRQQIIEDAGVGGSEPWEVIARILADRWSCRSFLPDPVPHDTIRRLLNLAQLSASWCNAQPWNIIVTEGEGTDRFREALFEMACGTDKSQAQPDYPFPSRYEGTYGTRRRETAYQLYQSVGIEFGDRAASGSQALQNFRLFGAPHAIIITTDAELGVYGAVDCGIYIGSLLNLMQAMGIASIPQAALAVYSPFIRQFFGLPENRKVVCGISFGYADLSHPSNSFRTLRARQEEVVTFFPSDVGGS